MVLKFVQIMLLEMISMGIFNREYQKQKSYVKVSFEYQNEKKTAEYF